MAAVTRGVYCESEGKAARARLPIKQSILMVSFYLQVQQKPLEFYENRELSGKKIIIAQKTPVRRSILLPVTPFPLPLQSDTTSVRT